jgi:integrase
MGKKRGQGEGSIYQRSDGLWVAAISTPEGRKLRYAKTRQLAAQKLQELQQAAAGGLPEARRDITVEALMDEYLAHKKAQWRPRSYQSAEASARLHIVPTLGNVKLADITPHAIQAWLRKLGESRTSAKARQHLRAACHLALRWGWMVRNPVDATDPPSVILRQPPELSVELAGRVLGACEGTDAYPLVCVLLGCGMRIGEAMALRRSDWDRESATLTVTGQLQRIDGKTVRSPTKTKQGNRVVAISSWVQDALLALPELEPDELLFGRYGREWWRVLIMARLKEAGIEGLRLHDLRHAYASLLLDANVPIVQVSAALGHSKPSVTMSIYAHRLGGADRRTADALEGLKLQSSEGIRKPTK